MVPKIHLASPFMDKQAILIDRIYGRQLSVYDFEKYFNSLPSLSDEKNVVILDWIKSMNYQSFMDIKNILKECKKTKSIYLKSPLGIVHGDFAPWNLICKNINNLDKNFVNIIYIDWEFSKKNTPLIFDRAYAVWCCYKFFNYKFDTIDHDEWKQLVSLGELWNKIKYLDNENC